MAHAVAAKRVANDAIFGAAKPAEIDHGAKKFNSPYRFAVDGKMVVIKGKSNKFICFNGQNDDNLGVSDHLECEWKVHLTHDKGEIRIKLQRENTDNYLRIMKNGKNINCGGKGKDLCEFKVHQLSSCVVKLESVAVPGAYVSAPSTKFDVVVGDGGMYIHDKCLENKR